MAVVGSRGEHAVRWRTYDSGLRELDFCVLLVGGVDYGSATDFGHFLAVTFE